MKPGRATRRVLFECLSYTEVTHHIKPGLIPRYSHPLETMIQHRLTGQPRKLASYLQSESAYMVHCTRKLSWFVQITPFIPMILDEQGQQRTPSELKSLYFSSLEEARIVFVALNSNLFYWLLSTGSDCRNLNMREVRNFPLDLERIPSALRQKLCALALRLEQDLLSNAHLRQMSFKNRGQLTIQCMYPARSKHLIDEIDLLLAEYYGFSAEEVDFLLSYDAKYRRSRSQLQEVRPDL